MTRSVFFETLEVTFAPRASSLSVSSGRVKDSSEPVRTTVLPAKGESAGRGGGLGEQDGTGLGLAICRELVESAGGSIEVEMAGLRNLSG